ncbi:MAG: DUF559 domain-containing protein [Chloroflexi bacterium]|nr:DUF559 domain-containing protein [Chloroflexota bacterium]
MIGIRQAHSPEALWVTGDHRVLGRRRAQSYGGESSWRHVPKENFARARDLRREMTPPERSLWNCLRSQQLGVKFRRQHPIGPYIVDFYARGAGLIVEADGDSHFTPDAQAYDAERTAYLQSLGLNILRFTNVDIRDAREGVVMEIARALDETRPSDDPLWQWRRADSLRVGDVVCCLFGDPPKSPRSRGEFDALPASREDFDALPASRGDFDALPASRGTLTRFPLHGRTLTRSPLHGGTLTRSPLHGRTLTRSPVHGGTLTRSPVHLGTLTPSPWTGRVGVGHSSAPPESFP